MLQGVRKPTLMHCTGVELVPMIGHQLAPQPHTMVMTFSAAGWNLRIFFFRALEALMRHNLGTGGRGGLVPAGARGAGWGTAGGQACPPRPATP